MRQDEIEEISYAFLDAWKEFFGTKMQYIRFDKINTAVDDIYNESKDKKYKELQPIEFHGTIKERERLDITSPIGKREEKHYEITAVTQELIDGGLTKVDTNDVIRYVDRFGREYTMRIYDDFQKVQFVDNKIFTKMQVIHSEL